LDSHPIPLHTTGIEGNRWRTTVGITI
jgi:hypothetical protein